MTANFPDEYYFWDLWYIFEEETNTFHVYRLCAEKKLYQTNEHHMHSSLAYGTTKDFRTFKHIRNDILKPGEDASIWTGSIIRSGDRHYVMFYTERYSDEKQLTNQVIKKAESAILLIGQ